MSGLQAQCGGAKLESDEAKARSLRLPRFGRVFVIQAQADSVFMHCFRVAPYEDATRVTQTITKRNETISAAAKRHASRSPGPARSGVTIAT